MSEQKQTSATAAADGTVAFRARSGGLLRRLFKWMGRIVGGLLGLLLLALIALYIAGGVKWNREYQDYQVTVSEILIPGDAASVARGEYLATTHYCAFCHGDDLAGAYLINEPAVLVLPAPNLTPSQGGIGASNTDEDWIRALRHGVGHDGRGVVGMPARLWNRLSDDDLAAIIAYLKTLPPVDNQLPLRRIGPLGRVMLVLGQLPPSEASVIDHEAPRPTTPEPGVTAAYGRYLARSTCSGCHGVDTLNGGTVRGLDGELEVALNLTPGGRLAFWSEAEFLETLRTGVAPDGHVLSESMPWRYVGQMSDDELRAIWRYLQALPAMEQNLERTDPPR